MKKGFVLLFLLLLVFTAASAEDTDYEDAPGHYRPLTLEDTVGTVINHPLWQGIGADMYVNGQNPGVLRSISGWTIEKFYARFDPITTLESLNYLIDCVNAGEITVYPTLYTEDEIARDATKAYPKAVFYQGEASKPLAVVCAGGAFNSVVSNVEGFPYAMELHRRGYSALVLRYRVSIDYAQEPARDDIIRDAAHDLARALTLLREMGVQLENYTMFGSSAGGRLISDFAYAQVIGTPQELGLPAPATVNAIYGLDSSLEIRPGTETIGLFTIVGKQDEYFDYVEVERKATELKGILGEENVSFTLYGEDYLHGLGLGRGTSGEGWMDDAIAFWEAHMR